MTDAERAILKDAMTREEPAAALAVIDRGLGTLGEGSGNCTMLLQYAAAIAESLQEHDRAITYCRLGLANSPADTKLHWYLGYVLWNMGKAVEARAQFEKCLALATEQGDDSSIESARDALNWKEDHDNA